MSDMNSNNNNGGNNSLELSFDIDSILNKNKRRPKFKFEYLKDGVQSFRILPSFDAANRQLEHSYSVHWLTTENGKPAKVLCTYPTERFCPVCHQNRETKEMLEVAKKANPTSENTKRLMEAERRTSLSKSVYYNAVNASGEPVILELNSTVSKLLEQLIVDAALKKNFDPTALRGGVWFEFTKSGKGRDSVRVDFRRVSKLVDGEMVDILDRSPMAEDLIARLPNAVANIHDPKTMWIRTVSSSDLSDYLKGLKPLPEANTASSKPGMSVAGATSHDAESADAYAQKRGAVPTAVAATSTQVNQSSSSTQSPSGGAGKSISDFKAEAERLQALAMGGGSKPNGNN